LNDTPENCAEDDEDEDTTDEQGGWVVAEDEDADDTLPQVDEDMAAIDKESYVRLGELPESERKEAVGLLTKVSIPH